MAQRVRNIYVTDVLFHAQLRQYIDPENIGMDRNVKYLSGIDKDRTKQQRLMSSIPY